MRRACILLSTFNGARFIGPQLDSLLAQRDCEVAVLVRDDGSTDATLEILGQYERADSRVHVSPGTNVGVVSSFFTLLEQAPADFEAYLFCDQDDVWDDDKVCAALRSLEKRRSLPVLYCSRLRYIDEAGRSLGTSRYPRVVGLSNALVQNIAVGCTSALNGEARRLIVGMLPRAAIMHDWWCYLVVSALGSVVFDGDARIGYRQHGANAVGAGASRMQDLIRRLQRRRVRAITGVTRAQQAAELLRLHGSQLSVANRRLVEDFVFARRSIARRVRLVWSGAVQSGNRIDQAILSGQILLNDY